MDSIAGMAIMAPAIKWDFNLVKSVSGLEINLAKASAVKILHNSAGCKLNPPAMGIQLLDPLISFPITKVANINRRPLANKIFAKAVKTLLSTNKIKMATKEQKIKKKELFTIARFSTYKTCCPIGIRIVFNHENSKDANTGHEHI